MGYLTTLKYTFNKVYINFSVNILISFYPKIYFTFLINKQKIQRVKINECNFKDFCIE